MAYQTTRGVDSGLLVDVPRPAQPKANWAGILADAIAGALGQPGQYAAGMERRRGSRAPPSNAARSSIAGGGLTL